MRLVRRIDNALAARAPWLWRMRPGLGLLTLVTSLLMGLLLRVIDQVMGERALILFANQQKMHPAAGLGGILIVMVLTGWFISISRSPSIRAFPYLQQRPRFVANLILSTIVIGLAWLAWGAPQDQS